MGQPFTLEGERAKPHEADALTVEFVDAGHVLGAAGVILRAEGRTIFYSGDVNFDDQTITKGAVFPESGVDVLIMETTRGDSPLPEGFTRAAEERRLADAIERAFSARRLRPHAGLCAGQNAGSARHDLQIPASKNCWVNFRSTSAV